MIVRPPCKLRASVPVPELGRARCIQQGRWQLILERDQRGLAIFAHDGRRMQRWLVGTPADAVLEIGPCAPRFPVRVHFTQAVSLAAGGKLRGYVAVPLAQEVALRLATGDVQPLAELIPQDLQTSWLGEEIGYVHEVRSSFSLDTAEQAGHGDALIPLILRNMGAGATSPAVVTIHLQGQTLKELRSRVFATPRALDFTERGQTHERTREFIGARS